MASAYDTDEAFERLMDDLQIIYTLKAGVALSQADVDAIQRFEQHSRDEEESAVEAFHRGYQAGLLAGGGVDVQTLRNDLDAKASELSIAKALGRFSHQHGFRRGAQACREMLARFVEQGGDATTAASLRANWNPLWGDDPGPPQSILTPASLGDVAADAVARLAGGVDAP
jgi:hypothetical protein